MALHNERFEERRREAQAVLTAVLARPENGDSGVSDGQSVLWLYVWSAIVLVLFGLGWSFGLNVIDMLGVAENFSLEADLTKLAVIVGPLLLFVVGPFYAYYRVRERNERQRLAEALDKLKLRPIPMVGALCQLHPEGGMIFQINRLVSAGVVDLIGVVDADGLPFDEVRKDMPLRGLFEVGRG